MRSILGYGESKLANILHMRQCARLRKEVQFFSIHPGLVATGIGEDVRDRIGRSGPFLNFLTYRALRWIFRTPFEGAQTSIYCAASPKCENPKLSGNYFTNCAVSQIKIPNKSEEDLLELQETLWSLSEEYTSSTLPCINNKKQ